MLQIQHSLNGQGMCHLHHKTDCPLPGSLQVTAFQTPATASLPTKAPVPWATTSLALSALPLKFLEGQGQMPFRVSFFLWSLTSLAELAASVLCCESPVVGQGLSLAHGGSN